MEDSSPTEGRVHSEKKNKGRVRMLMRVFQTLKVASRTHQEILMYKILSHKFKQREQLLGIRTSLMRIVIMYITIRIKTLKSSKIAIFLNRSKILEIGNWLPFTILRN